MLPACQGVQMACRQIQASLSNWRRVEAIEDLAPSHKRRFAMLSVPREELMAALGVELRQKTAQGKAPRPRLVSEDE